MRLLPTIKSKRSIDPAKDPLVLLHPNVVIWIDSCVPSNMLGRADNRAINITHQITTLIDGKNLNPLQRIIGYVKLDVDNGSHG